MASEETEINTEGEKPEGSIAPSIDSAGGLDDSFDEKASSMYTTADEEDKVEESDKKFQDPKDSGKDPKVEDGHEDGVEVPLGDREDGDVSDDDKRSGSSMSSGSQVPDTEREEGDGQEEGEKKDKKLDHDEDRRDPQYIPKRGIFYEHDDRTMDEDADAKKEPVREPRKSRAFEAAEKWGHDMYDECEQSPKSTEELIDTYGYDIRKEEAPPKARRRRRYGKGPNKYQRSWEDEQAYNKSPLRGGYRGGQRRPPRNFVNRDEDFPSLPASGAPDSDEPARKPDHKGPKLSVKFPPDNVKHESPEEIKPPKVHQDGGDRRPRETTRGRASARRGRGGSDGPPFKGHGQSHAPNDRQNHGKGPSTADEDIATLAQHFSNAVINIDKNIAPIRSQSEPPAEEKAVKEERQQHQGSVHQKHHDASPLASKHLPTTDVPSTKSKRYSTQRQRPAQPAPQGTTQQIAAPQGPAPNYLPPQQGYFPPQHGMIPPDGPTPHMAGPPSQFPPPPGGMQMVTFLPTVPPPPTNTFQPPPNIYVPPAPFIPPPPIVQPGPAELYQGGVTYYNTQSQQLSRAAPSRRVKLAIPIVAPDSSAPIQ